MQASRQQEWLTDLLETTPSIVFLALWHSELDTELAGWIGAGLATAVLVGFRLAKVRFNPILLGLNAHLAAITPLVVGLFQVGSAEVARLVIATAPTSALAAVLAVGIALTVLSPRGLIGVDDLPASVQRSYSVLLLMVSAAAIPWSLAFQGRNLLAIGLPLMLLFGLRRLLIARWRDRSDTANPGALAAAGLGTDDFD